MMVWETKSERTRRMIFIARDVYRDRPVVMEICDELERAAPILERLRELQQQRSADGGELIGFDLIDAEDYMHGLLDLYQQQYGGGE